MRLGVCSWSLRASSPGELAAKARECGVDGVQLALDPIRRAEWPLDETKRALRDAGIDIISGMMAMKGEDYSTLESIRRTGGVRPDETWDDNLAAARANADIAYQLGLTLVTFHAGFIPEGEDDAERGVMIDRLRALHRVFDERGVRIGLETGQEPAAVVGRLIDDLGVDIGVNFDPANMILYGMGDPIEAIAMLADRVVQIHIKDALASARRGEWGKETPAGEGAVDWGAFFGVVEQRGLDVDLLVEREDGGRRVEDVRRAASLVRGRFGDRL